MFMAAVDQYCTVPTTSNLNMVDFPSDFQPPLDISDYIDEDLLDFLSMPASDATQLPKEGSVTSLPPVVVADGSQQSSGQVETCSSDNSSPRSKTSEQASDQGRGRSYRVAFRTRSEVEILDDGFRWRKYGTKTVKKSPNPRNYYRCSTEGCSVKKRIERDPNEPSYVVTTYEGVHNHASLDVVYYATQDSESGRFVVSGCHRIN